MSYGTSGCVRRHVLVDRTGTGYGGVSSENRKQQRAALRSGAPFTQLVELMLRLQIVCRMPPPESHQRNWWIVHTRATVHQPPRGLPIAFNAVGEWLITGDTGERVTDLLGWF